ncbi:hypothetical protein KI688_012195 [Linnemannia hyalina]|uniref:LYR motif-containing protein Cup1-like N-terminal domain-containing protein n=1 Tax=Linnemannia hyalina TaxID=64524 RepID=A0A9P7XUL1_9FUNG|nr:hypothetical protein KI688_012195 [Linnemannia hyalina]
MASLTATRSSSSTDTSFAKAHHSLTNEQGKPIDQVFHWIRARAQETFRKNKSQKDEHRIQKYTSDARKALRLIERANQMDLKSVMRILRLSHGLQGKDRRILLQPFVDSTRARTLSADKLSAAIIASGSSTPSPTAAPLASSGTIRDSTTQHRLSEEQIEWEQRIMTTIKAWNKTGEEQRRNRWETGRFHPSIGGKPAKSNTLTLRLYRRIWQQLLNEVPILDVKLSALGPSELENKGAQEGSLKDARLERSLPHTPASTAYSVSKSAQAHQARSSAGLKLQALVNDFDQLGFSETSQPPQVKPKKKATSA